MNQEDFLYHLRYVLRGLGCSCVFIFGGILASPFLLGVLGYVGWKTGTDETFHWSQMTGHSVENVDKIKCNIIRLIESVKRLEADLYRTDESDISILNSSNMCTIPDISIDESSSVCENTIPDTNVDEISSVYDNSIPYTSIDETSSFYDNLIPSSPKKEL